MTPTRRVIRAKMAELARTLPPAQRVLEIGIAGDDPPGANREFFHAPVYQTADKQADLKPDFVLDLTEAPRGEQWDLVICSQVLEHVWDLEAAFEGLWRLTALGGRCIVDLPFCYPPHGDLGEQVDFWRLTPQALERLLRRAGFGKVEVWSDAAWLVTGAVATKEFSPAQVADAPVVMPTDAWQQAVEAAGA